MPTVSALIVGSPLVLLKLDSRSIEVDRVEQDVTSVIDSLAAHCDCPHNPNQIRAVLCTSHTDNKFSVVCRSPNGSAGMSSASRNGFASSLYHRCCLIFRSSSTIFTVDVRAERQHAQ